jgi:vitamin B12/bleomycin/antimicrobial peptide transport system ATP-binding/permease protein
MRKVTLVTPNYARILVRDLDVNVPQRGRVLVMGPSGCGKTSLLRAIGCLWNAGVGSIATPPVASASVRCTAVELLRSTPNHYLV